GGGRVEVTTRCSRTLGRSAFRCTKTSSQMIAEPEEASSVDGGGGGRTGGTPAGVSPTGFGVPCGQFVCPAQTTCCGNVCCDPPDECIEGVCYKGAGVRCGNNFCTDGKTICNTNDNTCIPSCG